MLKLTLVLFAILLLIGCVVALEQETNDMEYTRDVEPANACSPPHHSSSSSTSGSPATSAPTSKPTSRPTSRPTRPTSAPATPRPTAPTPRPTSTPTTKPTAPTPAPSKPTTKPTSAPTVRPTTAPTTKPSTTTGSSSVGLCDLVPTSQEPLKLLVPLYVAPGSAWDTIIAASSKVGIVAIINPNSGPASSPDSSYTTYMNKFKNAGIQMVGYVYTSYGARAISAVQADIDTYASKYPGVTGIFFDECSASASDVPFYTQAYNYVKSKGMVHSILNPGTQPDQGYVAISSSIVIFENAGSSASKSNYASWVKCASSSAQKSGYKYKFSGIAHSTASSGSTAILNTFENQGMGMVYVTDGAAGCCTYNTLVSYFSTEASTVASMNA